MKSVFNQSDVNEIIARIDKLQASSQALWGKMGVAQMLAHCNVSYEMAYENIHPKPGAFQKFIMKTFVKNIVVKDKPYKRSSQTAPAFIIQDDRNFENEKKRLIDYVNKTLQLGESHFQNKESHSFGRLNSNEWNTMFYKHLDHHLSQFGV